MAGLVFALGAPRGPSTAWQALGWLALGLIAGLAAGFWGRTRWALLVAPVAFVAAFELGRLGEAGPTVDAVRLDSTVGVLAFLTGRAVFLVLLLVTILPGAVLAAPAMGVEPHLLSSSTNSTLRPAIWARASSWRTVGVPSPGCGP